MRRFTVSCVGEGAAASAHRAALASLPARFRLVSGNCADVVVSVSSDGLPPGIRAAVVTDPVAARAAAVPVFPAWAFLPQLEANAYFLETREHATALICCTTTVAEAGMTGMRAALIEQLAVLRSLTGHDPAIATLKSTETGYTASVDLGATFVALAAVISPFGRDRLRLSAVGHAVRLDVALEVGRPAVIRLFGCRGAQEAMPSHQTSHRLTWLKVHAFLNHPDTLSLNAAVSDNDLAFALRWLGAP